MCLGFFYNQQIFANIDTIFNIGYAWLVRMIILLYVMLLCLYNLSLSCCYYKGAMQSDVSSHMMIELSAVESSM